MTDYRIEGLFTLKSPLSHIGETISATSYLVQERILQPDGRVEEAFVYSGNAWRGQLRDLAAAYMLDRLGAPRLGLDAFHLLFSGGRIGGPQSVDIEQARRMRSTIPMLALFGGGVGNQILQGKLRVGNCYPLCREAVPVLPDSLRPRAASIPYGSCTFEKQHSRRDDAKLDSTRRHLDAPEPDAPALAGETQRGRHASREQPADQMRIGMELVCAGVALHTWIGLADASEIELGALVSALHAFGNAPAIGGKCAIGYGLVDLSYTITNLGFGEAQPFVSVADGAVLLSPAAAAAKDAYDQRLRSLYDDFLAGNAGQIAGLLGAA